MPYWRLHPLASSSSSPSSTGKNDAHHFCSIQGNIGEQMCCQLVRLLNVPDRVPFCTDEPSTQSPASSTITPTTTTTMTTIAVTDHHHHLQYPTATEGNINSTLVKNATAISALFQRSYPKFGGGPPAPVMNLKVPPDEVPEEHLTFLFGVFMLISMAVICTLFLMRLAKAGSPENSAAAHYRQARCLGDVLPPSDYSIMLLLPNRLTSHRGGHGQPAPTRLVRPRRRGGGPSLLLLLRSSFRCGSVAGQSDEENPPPSIATPSSGGRSDRSTRELLEMRVIRPGAASSRGARGQMVPRGRSCLSIVSSSSMNALLPNSPTSNSMMTPSSSSGSAGLAALNATSTSTAIGHQRHHAPRPITTTFTNLVMPPPPPRYEDLEEQQEEEEEKFMSRAH